MAPAMPFCFALQRNCVERTMTGMRARRLVAISASMAGSALHGMVYEETYAHGTCVSFLSRAIQSASEHFGWLNVPVTRIGKTSLPCCDSAPLNNLAKVLTQKPCFV